MFGLIRRTHTSCGGPRSGVFLHLESLETRDQPDSTPLSTPPAIVNFSTQETSNGTYLITGSVTDANPGGLIVTLGGNTSASGQTTTTNFDDTFSLTVQPQAEATGSDIITATTIDTQGLQSQPVQVLVNAAPTIANFNAQEIGNGLFLITGTVIDQNPDGLTVTLGGGTSASGKTATTNEDGTFSLTVQLKVDGTDSGFITATTIDAQGLQSPPVQVFVTPTTP